MKMALIISSGHFCKVENGKETVIFLNNTTGRRLKKLYEKLNEPIEKTVRIEK